MSITQVELILLAFAARRNQLPEEEELLKLIPEQAISMATLDFSLFNRVNSLNLADGVMELRKFFGLPEAYEDKSNG